MLGLQCWCLLQVEVQAAGVTARAEKALKLVLYGNLSPFEDALKLPQLPQNACQLSYTGPALRPNCRAGVGELELERWFC
jgi:hypothetical protein